MSRPTTPNLGLYLSLPTDPAFTSAVDEHFGPIHDSNLSKIDSAIGAVGLWEAVGLTPQDIFAMDNTAQNAITIIEAPGPGLAVVVSQTWVNLQFNKTAYKGSTANLELFYGGGSPLTNMIATLLPSTYILGTASYLYAAMQSVNMPVSVVNNMSVVIAMDGPQKYTSGNSEIVVSVAYQIVSVS